MPLHIFDADVLHEAGASEPDNSVSAEPAALLHNVSRYGEIIRARMVHTSVDREQYTQGLDNKLGLHNHFQGLTRLAAPGWIAVSGSNWKRKAGEVFFVKLASRPVRGEWLTNVAKSRTAPPEDTVDNVVRIKEPPIEAGPNARPILWHGGGMDRVGHVLAVPVEHYPDPVLKQAIEIPDSPAVSAIRFLDVSNPHSPKLFRHGIFRPNTRAGAVAFTRLPGGHYLCAVWSDDDEGIAPRVDLYRSETTQFDGRFAKPFQTWISESTTIKYQALNFVECHDGLFMVGFYAESEHDPQTDQLTTYHRARLQRVEIEFDNKQRPKLVGLKEVTTFDFEYHKSFLDMKGASGAYVEPGGRLILYSGGQFLSDGQMSFSELRRPLPRPDRLTRATSFIEFYQKANAEGHSVSFQDLSGERASIPDYKSLYAGGRNINDKVYAIRYCLPTSLRYDLYRDKNYKNLVRSLPGTGGIDYVNLALEGLESTISSSKLSS